MNLVVDLYAWVELFLGSEEGKKVREIILNADEVRTPDLVLAEILRKYHMERVDDKRVKSRLETITSSTRMGRKGKGGFRAFTIPSSPSVCKVLRWCR